LAMDDNAPDIVIIENKKQHASLTPERWSAFSRDQQILMIGGRSGFGWALLFRRSERAEGLKPSAAQGGSLGGSRGLETQLGAWTCSQKSSVWLSLSVIVRVIV
jgi:hypothetical protein